MCVHIAHVPVKVCVLCGSKCFFVCIPCTMICFLVWYSSGSNYCCVFVYKFVRICTVRQFLSSSQSGLLECCDTQVTIIELSLLQCIIVLMIHLALSGFLRLLLILSILATERALMISLAPCLESS